mmetsp:Transcript_23336/g.79049  ORF Transcript_23336/g.79049 Transcript_23336/m.79049 type:complete len:564 (-) Transcript_23336:164-1855(-)
MGLLSDVRMYEACLVKNTFIDRLALSDGTEPPPPTPLCRARTEPARSCYSHESTQGSDSPRSSNDDAPPVSFSIPSSPGTSRGTPIAAEELTLDLPLGEDDQRLPDSFKWGLRVKGTFLEYHWSQPTIRRSSSLPDIGELDKVAEDQVPMMWSTEVGAATPDAAEWPVLFFPAEPQSSSGMFYDSTMAELWAAAAPMQFYQQHPHESEMAAGLPFWTQGPGMAEPPEPPAWVPQVDEDFIDYTAASQGRRRKKRGAGVDGPMLVEQRNHNTRSPAQPADEKRSLQVIEEARQSALEERPGKVWDLARRDRESSILVQKAFEVAISQIQQAWDQQDWERYDWAVFDAQAMLRDFSGHVVDALKHHHANHVIKLLAEIAPTELISFIVEELTGQAVWAAKHCYGCRTVLRLVRHCGHGSPASEAAEAVIDEVLHEAEELCSDEFGRFVLEEFLTSHIPVHRRRVAEALRARLVRNARHKHASGLIEKALRSVDVELGNTIVDELFSNFDTVQSLIRNQFGMYVLKDITLLPQYTNKVRSSLESLSADLQGSKQGRKLLELLATLD